jgi:rare lipoprotein A
VGRSGRHRHSDIPRALHTALLAATGLAAVALAAIIIAVTGSGPSSAQMRARAAPTGTPRPIDGVSRDDERAVIATPAPELSETPVAAAKKRQHGKVLAHGACEASYYGGTGHGRTASGEAFNPSALTAAHRSLPIGSKVRVTNQKNDRSVVVRINDRGPFVPGRCLDLSSAAMHAVGGLASGVIPVRYAVLADV